LRDVPKQSGGSVLRRGVLEKAKDEFQRALTILENKVGRDDPDVAQTYSNLGLIAYQEGDYVKAETLLQKALRTKEEVLGEDHPELALYLNNLAELYRAKGDYHHAEVLLERALTISTKAFGEDNVNAASPWLISECIHVRTRCCESGAPNASAP